MRWQVTPLSVACQNGHLGIVRCLTEAGADKDHANVNGVSPLFVASQNGHVDVVAYLIGAGADKNQATKEGASPIYTACFKGEVEVVKCLLEADAEMDRPKLNGASPLFVACQSGHLEVCDRDSWEGSCPPPSHHRYLSCLFACLFGSAFQMSACASKSNQSNQRLHDVNPIICEHIHE